MRYLIPNELKLTWLISILFSSQTAFALTIDNAKVRFPLPPRLTVEGTSGTNTFGVGDVMIPLWGNPNQSLYGDLTGKRGDSHAWFMSGGLGGRQIAWGGTILGAYFFWRL